MMESDFVMPQSLECLELEQTIIVAWQLLMKGAKNTSHPFHTSILSTMGQLYPESRVVVLRFADARNALLECHTDLRSGKVEQINRCSAVTWTFYDPSEKLQIRVRGHATVHATDDYAQNRWNGIPDHSKRCYAQELAAGNVVDEILDAAPCPHVIDAEAGRKNFAVVSCQVSEVEWLYLLSSGHQRTLCKPAKPSWVCQWIMP